MNFHSIFWNKLLLLISEVEILFQSWERLQILETMDSSWYSCDTVRPRQSRRHDGVLVGLAPQTKYQAPLNGNMKHYKPLEFLSNFNIKPPRHKRKVPPHERKAP